MKRLIYILAALATISIAGCKTTEKNYREAYEIALKKKNAKTEVDSLNNGVMFKNERPVVLAMGNDTLNTVVEYVRFVKEDGNRTERLKRFNIVVAQFRQLFNARSMMKRLHGIGYPQAFIVHNNEPRYYVITDSYETMPEAIEALDVVNNDTVISKLGTKPYVLQPPHLSR